METNKLYKIAEAEGISVDFLPLRECGGLVLQLGDNYYIALDPAQAASQAKEKVMLAHELGHCLSGEVYSPAADRGTLTRAEKKAEGWAIRHLVPASELITAIKRGDEALDSLALRFGVTEDFMQRVFKYYCEAGIA